MVGADSVCHSLMRQIAGKSEKLFPCKTLSAGRHQNRKPMLKDRPAVFFGYILTAV